MKTFLGVAGVATVSIMLLAAGISADSNLSEGFETGAPAIQSMSALEFGPVQIGSLVCG